MFVLDMGEHGKLRLPDTATVGDAAAIIRQRHRWMRGEGTRTPRASTHDGFPVVGQQKLDVLLAAGATVAIVFYHNNILVGSVVREG